MRHRAGLFVAVVALAAGCGGTARYEGPDGGPKVYVVGDSLVVEAWDDLRTALPGDRLAAHAERGTGTPWASERLRRQVQRDAPDVAIVASGTNDWPDGWTGDEAAAVESALQALDRVPCAIWVVPAGRFADVARRIVDAAAAHPGVHVARWDEASAGHPEWYREDGVHHSDEGHRAYADFIAGARRQLCPS